MICFIEKFTILILVLHIFIYAMMLEFKKQILQKVSFDLGLFEKELKKALNRVNRHEANELKSWCYLKFDNTYKPIFDRVF